MNGRRHKENKQLSLTFESSCQSPSPVQMVERTERMALACVIPFPSRKISTSNFREKVIQDLIRNRVMVE